MSKQSKYYTFGRFRLNPGERLLTREGVSLPLPRKAFDTLLYLVENPGSLLTKDEMMGALWPDTFVEEVNLAQNISQIRKVLGPSENGSEIIETIPKSGYRFALPVRVISEGSGQTGAPSTAPQAAISEAIPESVSYGHERKRTFVWIAVSVLGVLAPAFGIYAMIRGHAGSKKEGTIRIQSLLIMPLENASADSSQDAFALGLTDLVGTELSKIRSIRVVSHTSAQYYKAHPEPTRQIARELNVDGILEGSIVRSGDHLRLSAQLIEARSDRCLWAQTYERNVGDLLQLQNDLAQSVAGALSLQLAPEQQRLPATATNPEAVDAYLRGRALLRAQTITDAAQGQAYFQEAIQRDPKYALAYAGVAQMEWALIMHGAKENEMLHLMKLASDRALELDDQLAEAHAIRALVLIHLRRDWRAGESEFRRALALNPGQATIYAYYSVGFLSPAGHHEEAIAAMTHAVELEPNSPQLHSMLGYTYFMARRYQEAEIQFKKAQDMAPDFGSPLYGLMEVYEQQHKWPQATAAFRRFATGVSRATKPQRQQDAPTVALTQEEYWNQRIELMELIAKESDEFSGLAIAYTRAGQKQKAVICVEKAINRNNLRAIDLMVDPSFDPLRSDPQFLALLKSLDFPPNEGTPSPR